MPKRVFLLGLLMAMFLLIAVQAKADVIGIDVSRWQHTIDWNSASGQAGFAIIKAGGSDDGFYIDSQFERNRSEARRLGITRGYYYYAGGGNPIQEAEHFSNIVGPLEPGELAVMDFEINHGNPVVYSWQFLVRTEEMLGVKPLLYTNMNRVWGNDWQPVVENGNKLWGAIYDEDPAAAPNPGAWPGLVIKQYSSSGRIAGIDTAVDMNVLRGSVTELRALGMPGPAAPAPPAPLQVVPAVIVAPPVAVELPDPIAEMTTAAAGDHGSSPGLSGGLSVPNPQSWLIRNFFETADGGAADSLLGFEPRHPADAVGTVVYSVIGDYLFSGDESPEVPEAAGTDEEGFASN